MHGTMHDMRTAARSLVRAPRFTAVALLTLSVAIAVNAAMFTFVTAVFLRPLPYASPEQLRDVNIDALEGRAFVAPRIRQVTGVLAPQGGVAPYTERGFVVSQTGPAAEGPPIFVPGAGADDRLFGVLGVIPALGRAFTAADIVPGAAPTVVLSDRFWRVSLASGPAVIGSTIRIEGREHLVIGIMAPRFAFPDFAEIWVAQPMADARFGETRVLFRGRAGNAETAAQALEAALGASGSEAHVRMTDLLPRGGALLAALLGAICFVLLIACSNVANLVLARGTGRRQEIALRAALGASRGALVRYLSMEGLLIALGASVLGTLGSVWMGDLIVAAIPSDGLPVWFEMQLDPSVLGYIGALTAITVLISAALPAFTVTRGRLATVMNEAGSRSTGDRSSTRLRASFVGAQVALAMVLITGAALLLRAFRSMNDVDPGYAADSVVELRARHAGLPGGDDFLRAALDRLSGVAGITAVAATAAGPAGRAVPTSDAERAVAPVTLAVSAGFFEALGLPLVAGEAFEPGREQVGVAVISESAADLMFGGASSAIGATFAFDGDSAELTWRVIGVARDRRRPSIGGRGIERQRYVYVPITAALAGEVQLLARVDRADPLSTASASMAALRDLDPDVVLRTPRMMGDVERDLAGNVRFFASVFTAFGAVALGLAALGIWGVVSYTVSRRTREIGLRIALGATPTRVVREVAVDMLRPATIGLACGSLGGIAMGRLLRGVLFAVGAADPASLVFVVLVFGGVTLLSAWLPARRAARIDPLAALRSG